MSACRREEFGAHFAGILSCGFLLITLAIALSGCATPYPAPDPAKIPKLDTAPLRQRAETMEKGDVRARVAALSIAESRELFGVPLGENGIQPVWIEVENGDRREYFFSPLGIDPEYYAPFELAWKFRSQTTDLNLNELGLAFTQYHFPLWIMPGTTASGFVFTRADQGAKAVSIDLVSDREMKHFDFVIDVPGLRADYLETDWNRLYGESEIRHVTGTELRELLENLPCCALGGDKKTPGDPLNLVIIGPAQEVIAPFVRRGWDLTETIHGSAVWRTIASSLFGRLYRTSPVSPLYVFDRSQEIALQKARRTVDERNHLRLWLTPYVFKEQHVWIGQISRDIGIRLTRKTLVTHKIDPDVDETRDYLVQDLIGSQYVAHIGYVGGVGAADPSDPRFNYTGDPYWTDGLRAIIQLSNEPVSLSQIGYTDWAQPIGARAKLKPTAR